MMLMVSSALRRALLPRWWRPGRFRPWRAFRARRRAWSRRWRWGCRRSRRRHHASLRLHGVGRRLGARLRFGRGLRLDPWLTSGPGLRLAPQLTFRGGLPLRPGLNVASGLRLVALPSFAPGLILGLILRMNDAQGASPGRHHSGAGERCRPLRCRNRRAALILTGAQHRVTVRGLLVLALYGYHGDVSLAGRRQFRRSGLDSAVVVADS